MTARVRSERNRTRNPGSQGALRQLNQQRILESLLTHGPSSQADLARQTGLSTATVSNIVKNLQEHNLVQTEPTTSSGRRALLVRLSDNGAVSVGIDFGRRHVRVVVSSLGYEILAEESMELPLGYAAQDGLAAVATLVDELLAAASVKRESVLGVGVGIPGPIDRRTDTVVVGAILPEWVGMKLSDLERTLKLPVIIDNDSNLGALAEVTWGPNRGIQNLMFVKIGSGIGVGLVLNGAPFYGHVGVTGEIGHTPVSENGLVCRCGNRGCLETVASTSVMIELLGRGSPTPVTTADIVRRGLERDPATLRVLEDVGHAIGRAIASTANMINPEAIVIGGPLAGLGDALLDAINRGFLRNALPIVGETTSVQMSSLSDRAEALGAVSLVLQQPGVKAL